MIAIYIPSRVYADHKNEKFESKQMEFIKSKSPETDEP